MSNKTLEQLARSLGVDQRQILKLAQGALKLPAGSARNPKYLLDPYQCKQIADALGHGQARSSGDTPAVVKPSKGDGQERLMPTLDLRPDPPTDRSGFEFENLNHGLWVHPDVLQDVHARKRLDLVLRRLGVQGRTTVVKGCRGHNNRGWRRSPLCGNQYYLWWAPQGSHSLQGFAIPAQDILVRAVRHHDDHSPLNAGALGNYLSIQQEEIEDAGLVGSSWTSEQLQFVESEGPVRLILGRPGSGKTTVLWKAIEARSDQAVLYLTWSRELTRQAEENLAAFAPADVRVRATDFTSFLGELRREDVQRQTLAESQDAFGALISRLGHDVLGPWAARKEALHAEVRAFLLGRALPGEDDDLEKGGVCRLGDGAYLVLRAGPNGVGKSAARALLKVIAAIDKEDSLAMVFPELAAATQAIECLRADKIPSELQDFDRVVVDEVQDLTLLEAAVVAEYCRAVARIRGHSPWLLVAGDEGQTVRPSGFDWGSLKDLIARLVAVPESFQLMENLRCPARIAEVVDRASDYYVDLEKERRPKKQDRRTGSLDVNAQLFHVVTDEVPKAIKLLEGLGDVENLRVISPSGTVADWVPDHLRDMVLTPAQAKGLEYQSVCLLEPGSFLLGLEQVTRGMKSEALELQLRRTAIDQLRVSLSRAAETLIFLDVKATEEEREHSASLLQDPVPFDPEDLLEHFADADVSAEERVVARTRDARVLVEQRPLRAWRLACQAMRLLGSPTVPGGVSDPSVRDEAWRTQLAIAARLLVDGVPPEIQPAELLKASREALQELDIEDPADAITLFGAWCESRSGSPFEMLEAIQALGGDDKWLREALPPVAQQLLKEIGEGGRTLSSAPNFKGDVAGWLRLCGYAGDPADESRRLRCQAIDTLLEAGDPCAADDVLGQVEPPDLLRTAKVREAQGDFESAAEAFKRLGQDADVLRNWRAAGQWKAALPLSEGAEQRDLMWLNNLEQLAVDRPSGHRERLTEAEQERLENLLDSTSEGQNVSVNACTTDDELLEGKIRVLKTGYGFIQPTGTGDNMYFTHHALTNADFKDLTIGTHVRYKGGTNKYGSCADEIDVVGADPSAERQMTPDNTPF